MSASQKEAPEVTSCVTAVRYCIEKITGESFPGIYIGDMPRIFLENKILGSKARDIKESCTGDLVFYYGISRFKEEMIRHVGIVLDTQGNFFHSAWPSKNSHGGRVENMYDEKVYNKISTLKQFYASRDPRNKI